MDILKFALYLICEQTHQNISMCGVNKRGSLNAQLKQKKFVRLDAILQSQSFAILTYLAEERYLRSQDLHLIAETYMDIATPKIFHQCFKSEF